MAHVDKIIVTNRKALVSKYGSNGFRRIKNEIKLLIAADNNRGIKSQVVYLDDETCIKRMNGKAVKNTTNPCENKETIDTIFKFFNPHYLMILGATDIVPHQDLDNPVYRLDGDDDAHTWSDLPYSCDTPYSRDPTQFIGPTRVIGRLPDLVGTNEPSYIISLLKIATNYISRSPDDYVDYLGLSAEKWKGSTQLSIKNIFGNANKLLLSPPSGPNYKNREIHNRMHFINCHGSPAKPEFYGQRGNTYPISLTTKSSNGKIIEGTIASVECCYGAELYDSVTLAIDKPICQSYLQQGAYGYFGSTTIAYGPSNSNGAADLLCQYFLQNVLNGISLGRAALMARQQFIEHVAQMDGIDLKTLSQFYLLGDPSIHPITKTSAISVPTGVTTTDMKRFLRTERRKKIKMNGEFLMLTKPTASKKISLGKLSLKTRYALSNIIREAGLSEKQTFTAFAVKGVHLSEGRYVRITDASLRYLVSIGTPEGEKMKNVNRGVAIVVKELNGFIMDYRIYHQR